MRIGAVAAATGVSVETLRFYERRGLFVAPTRLASGYRDYPDHMVNVVRFVKHAQQLGFTLDDIAGLLHLADGGPDNCDAVRDLAIAKVDHIIIKINQLVGMRRALQQLVDTCQRPRRDRECPLLATELTAVPAPDAGRSGR